LGYVRPYRARLILAAVTLVAGTLLGLAMPLVVRNVVDVVFVEHNLALLNRFTVLLFIIFLAQAFFSFVNRYHTAYIGERVVADLRQQFYRHLVTFSLRFFADRRTGEIVSRVTNDVTTLQAAVTDNLVTLLQQSLTLIGGVICLFWLDWRLTSVILLGIPIVTLTMVYLGRKIRRAPQSGQDRLAEATAVVDESIGGIRIVKSFAREAYEVARFTAKVEETFAAAMQRVKNCRYLGPTIGFMAFMSITITLWFGGYEVIQGYLSPGGLVAFLIFSLLVAGPIAAFSGLYSQFQAALGATERLFELLDLQPDIADTPNAYPLPTIVGRVRFGNVSFEYDSNLPVLHYVSLDVQPGQVVALVGPSGAGKTTLVNLIPRFYDVTSGCITSTATSGR
jgi:subfamily B ATP-binding cassette protein MsbA